MSALSRLLNLGPGKTEPPANGGADSTALAPYPPPDQWDSWHEIDSQGREREYMIVPATCFNCESACGLLTYIDKETLEIEKFEGNPHHPGSRGRTCAKGPATINQIRDPERILYPMKRKGPRGGGEWERVSWDEALDAIGTHIRKAYDEGRKDEIMYHVGRPGADGQMDRVLHAWGIDGHNSHTNVCSANARLGYNMSMGSDRAVPDYANSKFILLLNSHMETGHYFNPYAQRITDARKAGTKIATMDTRLSNTASMSDYWLPTWPGSESTALLAMANVILNEGLFNQSWIEQWVNWEESLEALKPDAPRTIDSFIEMLKELYAEYTPERAEEDCGVPAAHIREVAIAAGEAGSAFSSYVWRNTAAGNRGGWMVARSLMFLHMLTGSVGTVGGVAPHMWNKFAAGRHEPPPAPDTWNEMTWPLEYPLTHYEMSILLPHFVREGRGRIDTYFTRVYNPVWTNPDGFSWIELLTDEKNMGLHVALTPTWSETAHFADYVLPMGLGPERHDLQSQETHHGKWIAFRQPVLRAAFEKLGREVNDTRDVNPGEVWEEDEFWNELSWRVDPNGDLGIRKYFESPYRPGEKITINEQYTWIFENGIPGLPEAAAKENLSPMEYMRKYGVFEVRGRVEEHEIEGEDGTPKGFPTPSGKIEFFSPTLNDWGWPEVSYPTTDAAVRSQVDASVIDSAKGEYLLIPTFRLPTLIHTRSANAKWLNELSHANPLWLHPEDATRLNLESGSLARVSTAIGHFVVRTHVTEGIRPGVVACSHHIGRWGIQSTDGDRTVATVALDRPGEGRWRLRQQQTPSAYESDDPDTSRRWWSDSGVNQNLTFPVQPDPVSGMHCWHQKVTVEPAHPGDQYGDVEVDTNKSFEYFREWIGQTRPAPGPDGTRRPHWLSRPLKPQATAFQVNNDS